MFPITVLQNTFEGKVNSFKKEGVTDEVFKRQIMMFMLKKDF